jgi:hypothetical protein
MSVGPVSSASVSEVTESKINSRDVKNDHDKDDAAAAAPASPSTTNASGQSIGAVISKSA